MTQKIIHTLQKLPPERCRFFGALFIAVMVHLLLVLFFRHTPAESLQDTGELPKVGRIVLSDKSNAELALWVKNHDPAVMTTPDTVLGYSTVLNTATQRNEPEDLPNLVQPVMPQSQAGKTQVGQLKVDNKGLLISCNAVAGKYADKEKTSLPSVVLNGEYSRRAGVLLTAVLADIQPAALPDFRKLPDTVLEIVPGRFEETVPRIILSTSCGNQLLDRKAVETLYKYILESSRETLYYGKVLFIWRNFTMKKTSNREQKI